MREVIVFDAVGTLIHPQPDVGTVYAEIARRHGSRLDVAMVRARFGAAFRRQEQLDIVAGHVTSEERELRRWAQIVGEVLEDADDPDACFRELYEWFGRPEAWRCEPGTAELLADLAGLGHRLGMASNFDRRLHGVVAGLPALRAIEAVVVSSEVGYRKPHGAFFEAVAKRMETSAGEIVYVGDDPDNDYAGATAAGMRAVLVGSGVLIGECLRFLASDMRS